MECTLLYFTVFLLVSEPESVQNNGILSPDLKLAYIKSKRWTVLLEVAGSNSWDLIRSRLILTLFEVGHGLYPAACISFGAVIGAAEALNRYSDYKDSMTRPSDEEIAEACAVTSAIVIMDRLVMNRPSRCTVWS